MAFWQENYAFIKVREARLPNYVENDTKRQSWLCEALMGLLSLSISLTLVKKNYVENVLGNEWLYISSNINSLCNFLHEK